MKKITPLVLTVLLTAGLAAGCSTMGGPKQTGGAVIGAGLGGLAGSQIGGGKGALAATAAGAVLGGLVGAETGASLDKADRAYAGPPPQAAPSRYQVPLPGSAPYGGRQVPYQPIPATTGSVQQGCERLESGGYACQAADGTWNIFR